MWWGDLVIGGWLGQAFSGRSSNTPGTVLFPVWDILGHLFPVLLAVVFPGSTDVRLFVHSLGSSVSPFLSLSASELDHLTSRSGGLSTCELL